MVHTGKMAKLFAVAVLVAVGSWAQASTLDEKALEGITARNNQFRNAVVAHDAAAAAAIYDENVVFMAPDIPTLNGKAAVQSYLQQQINAGAVDIQLTTEQIRPLISLSGNQNMQYEEIGTNVITFNFGGQLVQIPGKYIVIWDFNQGINNLPLVFRDSFSFNVPLKK